MEGLRGRGVAWTVGLVSGALKHESRGTEGTGTVQCKDEVAVNEKSPWWDVAREAVPGPLAAKEAQAS